MGKVIKPLKKINPITIITTLAVGTFKTMVWTFKWYEKHHRKKGEIPSRPIIKGV